VSLLEPTHGHLVLDCATFHVRVRDGTNEEFNLLVTCSEDFPMLRPRNLSLLVLDSCHDLLILAWCALSLVYNWVFAACKSDALDLVAPVRPFCPLFRTAEYLFLNAGKQQAKNAYDSRPERVTMTCVSFQQKHLAATSPPSLPSSPTY